MDLLQAQIQSVDANNLANAMVETPIKANKKHYRAKSYNRNRGFGSNMLSDVFRVKANIKKTRIHRNKGNIFIDPVKSKCGKMIEARINSETGNISIPKIIEPIELDRVIIEAEITPSFEVMIPEIIQTLDKPFIDKDTSVMTIGDEIIKPELSDTGEEYDPEIVEVSKTDGGQPIYRIVKYNRTAPLKTTNGNVLKPYKLACGSVVTANEIYESANGEVYKNAAGGIIVEKAVLVSSSEPISNNKIATWLKLLIAASIIGLGIYIYKVYEK